MVTAVLWFVPAVCHRIAVAKAGVDSTFAPPGMCVVWPGQLPCSSSGAIPPAPRTRLPASAMTLNFPKTAPTAENFSSHELRRLGFV